MDTKCINQYGIDILSYRMRTARHKKRMQYNDFDKELIQLHREEKCLWKQKRNLGCEPLHPPVQKGWKRFFVLRDDVAKSKDADFFQSILNKINTHDWSYRKDFKIKKRRFGRKVYVVKQQQLLKPYAWQIEKLKFSEAEKQCFHEVWEYNYAKQLVQRYVFNEPWRFKLIVKPNMITKIRKTDALMESRLDEIDNYMKRNDYRKRQYKLLKGSYQYKWKGDFEKHTEKNLYRNKSLSQILDLTKLHY